MKKLIQILIVCGIFVVIEEIASGDPYQELLNAQGVESTLKIKKRIEEVEKLILPLAEQGNLKGIRRMGNIVYLKEKLKEDGVPKNYEKSLEWMKLLAGGENNADDYYVIGTLYHFTLYNIPEAIKWYRYAAKYGHAKAKKKLDALKNKIEVIQDRGYLICVRKMECQSKKSFRSWVEDTYKKMDIEYENVKEHIKNNNWGQVFKISKPLAEKNHAKSQYALAYTYLTGQGVEKDFEEALFWFRLSAEQGYSRAQYKLGLIFKQEDKIINSKKWLGRAAEQGNEKAKQYLAEMKQ
tara:strand:- start:4 stop:888 length:885 start_codon:yes stop_codon:yes gene_type:complete